MLMALARLGTRGGTVMTTNLLSWLSSAYQFLAALPQFVDDHNGALIAIATIAIAWFTFTLKRSTVKMWRVTNDVIALLERPQIGAYNTTFKNISRDVSSVNVYAINYGRMPGVITEVGIKFFDTEILPARSTSGATISTINVPVIPAGIISKTAEAAGEVDTFEFDVAKKAVWIWIRYEWSLGSYEHSFACEVAYGRQSKLIGGKEYNYDVKCKD
jgi:hypothetical protein